MKIFNLTKTQTYLNIIWVRDKNIFKAFSINEKYEVT